MEQLNYAIIGSGMMGREHIQNLSILENVGVSAICEPDARQQELSLELVPDAAVYNSVDDLLKDTGVDAFVISAPNFMHADILKKIMSEDSRPVLVEKPLCTSKADCFELLEMSEKYGAPIWVAMEYRYMPVSRILMERIYGDELIGKLHSLSVREHRFPFLKKVGDWNRFNEKTGGTLVEKCCHFFDLVRLMMKDEVVQVYASGAQDVNFLDERYEGRRPDIIDNAFVIMELESGKRAFLDLCMFCDGSWFQEDICVVGERGKLEGRIPGPERLWAVDDLEDLGASTGFEGETRSAEIVFSPRKPKGPIVEEVKTDESLQMAGDHHGGTFFQHKYFYEAVTAGRKVDVSVTDGVKSVLIGLAAQRSIESGEAVEVERL